MPFNALQPFPLNKSPQRIRKFTFSSLPDLHGRLSICLRRFGDDLDYIAFEQTPIRALDEFSENRLLKIVEIDGDTATLIFRPTSSVHTAAQEWMTHFVHDWHKIADPDEETERIGASTARFSGSERQPDGAWGPSILKTGGDHKRMLVFEVGYSEPPWHIHNKLEYWFNAGTAYALIMQISRTTRKLTLELWTTRGHATRANRLQRLVSQPTVTESNGATVAEGSTLIVPKAAIAAREARPSDLDLVITIHDLVKFSERVWAEKALKGEH
ncbi:hypothetical protein KEM56_000662 [Ascosphaera pollenicola]|nr:hypothetical protein KEM56_000662 [Ascosphaera pollenicola]